MQEVGVKLDKHNAIKIDEYSRTSVDNIWSVGDVTMRMPLTPVAIMEGMAFAATCFGNKPTTPVHEKVLTRSQIAPDSALTLCWSDLGPAFDPCLHPSLDLATLASTQAAMQAGCANSCTSCMSYFLHFM